MTEVRAGRTRRVSTGPHQPRGAPPGDRSTRVADVTGPSAKAREAFDAQPHYRALYMAWLWPQRNVVGAVVGLGLVAAVLQMMEPLILRYVVDDVLLSSHLTAASRYAGLKAAGVALLALVLGSAFVELVRDLAKRALLVRTVAALRRRLFTHMLRLPIQRIWELRVGGAISRLSGDVETAASLMEGAIISPATALVKLVVAMGVVFAVNWRLAAAVIAVLPGAMVMSFVLSSKVRPLYRSLQQDAQSLHARAAEALGGIRVVRTFGQAGAERLRYARSVHAMLRKELSAHRSEVSLWCAWGLLVSLVNAAILWFGGYFTLRGSATVGDVLALQAYVYLLLTPAWSLVGSFSELQRARAAAERLFDLLAVPVDKLDRPTALHPPRSVSSLSFHCVSFSYDGKREALSDLSLEVGGNSVTAIVGPSGAGKSTMVDLLCRLHDPTCGSVRLNDVDIRSFKLQEYRDLFALVEQGVFLFEGTVFDNIAYGTPTASAAEVCAAAQAAHAHEFIEKLPGGYAATIGERGVTLSGGQQQRIALARAFLKAPAVLILDEATSNLDAESEALIQEAMANLVKGRTTFVVAHRLATVRLADKVVVLHEGRIHECGTHDELLRADGMYRRMVQLQSLAP